MFSFKSITESGARVEKNNMIIATYNLKKQSIIIRSVNFASKHRNGGNLIWGEGGCILRYLKISTTLGHGLDPLEPNMIVNRNS